MLVRDGGGCFYKIFAKIIPFVEHTVVSLYGGNISLFVVVHKLHEHITLPVPEEDHLKVGCHGHHFEIEPVPVHVQ